MKSVYIFRGGIPFAEFSRKFLEKLEINYYIVYMSGNRNISHVGKTFGKLTVVSFSHKVKYKSGSTKKFWLCQCECGNETKVDSSGLLSGRSKSCGCLRNKGGKINKDGYKFIYDSDVRKYISEHRAIYENHYNVKLSYEQNIHHINGDRLDNRIENLELWDTSQPKGQRVEDKILFYKNIYEKYKDHPKYKHLLG